MPCKETCLGGIMRRTTVETNQQRQGKPVESLRSMQVHSGASSTASAPADTLFVGRAVSVVTRPPACNKNSSRRSVEHTHTHTHTPKRTCITNISISYLHTDRIQQFGPLEGDSAILGSAAEPHPPKQHQQVPRPRSNIYFPMCL